MVEFAAPKKPAKQSSMQYTQQEKEKDDDQLQVAYVRQRLNQRYDRNSKSLKSRDHLEGSQHLQDSENFQHFEIVVRFRVHRKQRGENTYKVDDVPVVTKVTLFA